MLEGYETQQQDYIDQVIVTNSDEFLVEMFGVAGGYSNECGNPQAVFPPTYAEGDAHLIWLEF